ncbi:Uncharacterised protein [Bacteroides xylanisolvens]|nr:Uncharacterised protein [Bacteroides xylanisolvens]
MGNKGGIPFYKKNRIGRIDFHKPNPSLCFFSAYSSHKVKKGLIFIIWSSFNCNTILCLYEVLGSLKRLSNLSSYSAGMVTVIVFFPS